MSGVGSRDTWLDREEGETEGMDPMQYDSESQGKELYIVCVGWGVQDRVLCAFSFTSTGRG